MCFDDMMFLNGTLIAISKRLALLGRPLNALRPLNSQTVYRANKTNYRGVKSNTVRNMTAYRYHYMTQYYNQIRTHYRSSMIETTQTLI